MKRRRINLRKMTSRDLPAPNALIMALGGQGEYNKKGEKEKKVQQIRSLKDIVRLSKKGS